ncbi:hypothetical protein HTZ84_14070 [Haloterrigena sp. SYSU A558-1]|uniref:PGF-CTERM sorting domain-containing protein n=1 Tax=Haloterrigena gelatinilytica TaxID=2741724 RepID=A0A8J8GJE9_9EURY|nr:hypothetical protein [Haloterrigena gelatinilytica]NUB90756.1 hypothetical protein [Haloterrigena gelatinilytica]NUC73426.1 hypothetical protein [Haloterrigena gelatinilytica]
MRHDDTDTPTTGSESASHRRGRDRSPLRGRAFRTLAVALAIATVVGTVALGSVGAAALAGEEPPTTEPSPAMTDGAASAGGASSGAEPALVISDATVGPDSTGSLRVSLTDVPDGLAGFKIALAVDDGDVATVTNASYPDHFGLTTDPAVGADGETITVEAADLDDAVTAGDADVTLATIDVTGADAGQTDLRVTSMQVDDDDGGAVDPSLEAGTLTVGDDAGNEDSGSDGSESDDTGSESDDNDSESDDDGSPSDDGADGDGSDDGMPGFAAGSALAALAVLVAAVFAHRR